MAVIDAGDLLDGIATNPRTAAATTRVASLDSLRGLAALSVVICHYLILLANTSFGAHVSAWLQFPPLSLFKTAYGAVILFFVLSGYVLALSFFGESGSPNWRGFAARRFCRIWPPYAATILVSFAIGHIALAANPVLPSVWQTNIWRPGDMTLGALAGQISMAGSEISLDLPGWSLIHELRITLAFPLLLLVLRRAPATTIVTSLGLHLASRLGPPWLAELIPGTVGYIVFFAAGAWLALYGARIGGLNRATALTVALLSATSLFLLSVPGDLPWSGVVAGVGSVSIIAVVTASPRIDRLLSAPWCGFLGRVSYSLYLTHVVVLMGLGAMLGPWLPVWLILFIAAPIIAIVAWAGYCWLEQPSIRLGRLVMAHLT